MEIEFRSNGKVEMELVPSTEIEIAFVKEFLRAGSKGQTVRVGQSSGEPLAMVVSVEK